MEILEIFRWALIATLCVSLYVPLTIPIAAGAFRVQLGPKELPFETDALWWRSTGMGLGLGLMSCAILWLDYNLVRLDLPAGMVHLVFVLLFLPASIWFCFWIFGLEDFTEAVAIYAIFYMFSGLIIGLGYVLSFELPIDLVKDWIETGV